MKQSNPKTEVEVAIMCHNSVQTLPAAIESVLTQAVPATIVVSDDASTDETPEIASKYARLGVVYRRYDQNLGQSRHWWQCIQRARSPIFAVLHADDWYEPGALSEVLQLYKKKKELEWIFAPFYRCSKVRRRSVVAWHHEATVFEGAELFEFLSQHNYCLPSAAFFRTDFLRRGPRPNSRLKMLVDRDYFLRLSMDRPSAALIKQVTTSYSTDSEGATSQAYRSGAVVREFPLLYDSILSHAARIQPRDEIAGALQQVLAQISADAGMVAINIVSSFIRQGRFADAAAILHDRFVQRESAIARHKEGSLRRAAIQKIFKATGRSGI